MHKAGGGVCLYSRKGKNLTDRFTSISDAVLSLPARSAIIDGELVAGDTEGEPDFFALMRRRTDGLCIEHWADLSSTAAICARDRLLFARTSLRDLLIAADDHTLRFSESFDDPEKLLAVADQMDRRRGRPGQKPPSRQTTKTWLSETVPRV